MANLIPARLLAAGLALAVSTSPAWAATPAPAPFTATYQVLQGGSVIGEAVVSLKATGDGQWEYSNQTRGTAGLAAALGANTSDTTRFRWNNGAPETVTYDSRVNAFKVKQRHTQVDWNSKQVSVDEGKGPDTYAAVPGLIDRNTTSYAIGLALRDGKKQVTLPVAVRKNVENQQYKVAATENVNVPAGQFKAERVERTDTDKAFSAWYVPGKYVVPVKLAQSEGGGLTLQLVKYEGR
ncbi:MULTISPECIES: DUF3108 domain-containing protein [Dyella]|uniref:DUF3108 domain-containing protein n=2 Tax=Dyella TaxID=231454 RepID=A0A4R0YH81_9GAMM|nr:MULTISPECIES: DUF3108 domain-containing protein [Dyella]TBR37138.1 DUF3108 domain-containing protein [Dyella terrae]TCI07772.1 DUF3108 domain-containing protein [Dyella soli]